jgi:predicted amidophosphoribosyltransferase
MEKAMIAKCKCQVCGEDVEFDVEQNGQAAICPTCGRETVVKLSEKPKSFQLHEPHKHLFTPLMKCKDCGAMISRTAETCPKCGAQVASLGNLLASLFTLAIFALFVWWFFFRH